MPEPSKKRGGSHSAREKGLKGVVVHVTPDDYAALAQAAAHAGLSIKEFCRLAALRAAGREPGPSPTAPPGG
jgi:hypothetical protein